MKKSYIRELALEYAYKWALKRNSLIVTKLENNRIYVSSHTLDNLNKPLENYNYSSIRFIHIEHVNL